MKTVETIDFGNVVLCDFCSTEHTPETTSLGGALHGSYAVCAKCAETIPQAQIKARASVGETFHAFVMRLRNGNNLMTITSFSKD